MKMINNKNINKESLYITLSHAHPGVVTAGYNTARGSAEDGEKKSLDEESAL